MNGTLQTLLEQGGRISAHEAAIVIARLAETVHRWHAAGWLHREIDLQKVSFDRAANTFSLDPPSEEARSFGGADLNEEQCPPELRSGQPLAIPRDLERAGRLLADAGVSLDPRRIDVYQLGTLLCRLLTGESIQSYLRSPRVKGRVPEELQPIVERSVGYNSGDRFTEAGQVAAALDSAAEQMESDADVPGQVVSLERPGASPDTAPSVITGSNEPDTSAPPVPGKRDRSPGREASGEPLPFQSLGHFQILAQLGQGGMGDVYKGYEEALDRTVAIKVLPGEFARQDDFVRRFHAEATAAAKVVHPNIVQIHFIGEDRGHHFFAMQYVAGQTLADLLASRNRLGVDETLTVVEQALSGLAAAHKQGLVHRDIKPGNILIDAEDQRVLLADFGLVKAIENTEGMTATGVVMGTVDYISPEQGRGKPVDGRSDLYSIGVLMYRMLSGRLPFEADSPTAMIFQHAYETPQPLSELVEDLPEPLSAVTEKLMAKSPEDRYQVAEEVLADLAAFRDGQPLPSGADLPPEPTSAESSGASSASARQRTTAVIDAPSFDAPPILPLAVPRRSNGLWSKLQARWQAFFHEHAPEALKQLQSTQQQLDGAVFEYERRCSQLKSLAREAEGVLGELERQAAAERKAAADAARLATETDDDEQAATARREQFEAEQAAEELTSQAAQQREQLDEMRVQLAKVSATLAKLTSQRDTLNARLKAAEARVRLAGGTVSNKPHPLLPALVAIALVGAVILVAALIAWYRSEPVGTVNVAPLPPIPQNPVRRIRTSEKVQPIKPIEPEEGPPGLVRMWIAHPQRVHDVAFSAVGRLVASAPVAPGATGGDHAVRLWDATNGKLVHTLEDIGKPLHKIEFSPDGTQLLGIVFHKPAGLHLWDVKSGRLLSSTELPRSSDMVTDMAFLPDGKTAVAVSSEGLLLVEIPDLHRTSIWTGPTLLDALAVMQTGDGLRALVGDHRGQITVFDVANRQVVGRFSERGMVHSLTSSADARLALAISHEPDGPTRALSLWDATNERSVGRLLGLGGWPNAITICPDGTRFVSPGKVRVEGRRVVEDKSAELVVWDVGTLQPIAQFPGHTATIKAVAVSANSRFAVSGSEAGELAVWRLPLSGELVPRDTGVIQAHVPMRVTGFPGIEFEDPTTFSRFVLPMKTRVGNDICRWGSCTKELIGWYRSESSTEDATLRFRVVKPTTVLLALHDDWGDDDEPGSWQQELTTRDEFAKQRWSTFGKLSCRGPETGAHTWTVFSRKCHSGESFSFRNHEYATPFLFCAVDLDPTPWGETAKLSKWINVESDKFNSSAISPDGRRLATGRHDGLIELWDIEAGRQLHALKGGTGFVASVSFTPDGSRVIAVGGGDTPAAWMWDSSSGKLLHKFDGLARGVAQLSVSSDGRWAAMKSFEGIRLLDLRDWKVKPLKHRSRLAVSPVFLPDGHQLVFGEDNAMLLWDLQRDQLKGRVGPSPSSSVGGPGTLSLKPAQFKHIAVTPDGQRAATIISSDADGPFDEPIRQCDLTTGKELAPLFGHFAEVTAIRYSPDGRFLVSRAGGPERTARVWNAASGEPLLRYRINGLPVGGIVFSADGRSVLLASRQFYNDKKIELTWWRLPLANSTPPSASKTPVSPPATAKQQDLIRPDSSEIGLLHDYSRLPQALILGEPVRCQGHTKAVHRVIFTPDGRRAISHSLDPKDRVIRIWDVPTGKELQRLEGHANRVVGLDVSPDGSSLLSWGNNELRLWDLGTGEMRHHIEGPATEFSLSPYSVRFSPDGKRAVYATTRDRFARVVDSTSLKEVRWASEFCAAGIFPKLVAAIRVKVESKGLAANTLEHHHDNKSSTNLTSEVLDRPRPFGDIARDHLGPVRYRLHPQLSTASYHTRKSISCRLRHGTRRTIRDCCAAPWTSLHGIRPIPKHSARKTSTLANLVNRRTNSISESSNDA